MNVELTTDITAQDLALLQKLYEASFPPEERRQWQQIAAPKAPRRPELHAIIADGHIAGMITLWHFDRFVYIEHLAVNPELRGCGVGSDAIKTLIEKVGGKPVVLEIEPPVAELPLTVARFKFYSRLGFSTIDRSYVQPPYSPELPSVALHLLATTPLPAGSTAATLYREVYNA